MIDWDWTSFGTINAWQSVVTIAVIIIALYIVGRFLIRFWPWLKRTIKLIDSLSQLPEFIKRTDERFDKTDESLAALRKQVENDHKTNLRDELTTVLERTKIITGQVDTLIRSDRAQWDEINGTKPARNQRREKGGKNV